MQCVVAWDLSKCKGQHKQHCHRNMGKLAIQPSSYIVMSSARSFADLPFNIANLDSVHLILENLKTDNPEVLSELSQFITAAEKYDQLLFQNVKLSGVQPNVLGAFMMSRSLYTEAINWEMHSQSF